MRCFLSFLMLFGLTACASNPTKFKVHSVSSLMADDPSQGDFKGLEFLADPINGRLKNRVNVFYLHGMGWTEDPEADPLGNDFLTGIASAYGLESENGFVSSPCGAEGHEGEDHTSNHIFVTPGATPSEYETAIPGTKLILDRLVCMDKQTLEVDPALEFVVYRIFWDDIFWNQLQFAHVGQDDSRGASTAFSALRRKYNQRLKDDMVNYGFSDAVMYLGPAGQDIRNAIRGAMCSAVLDAAGFEFSRQGEATSYVQACQTASNSSVKANQFAFVTESLGSKIAYDVMRETMTDDRDTVLDDMIAGSEIYMLANQLALLSLSDLTRAPKKPAQLDRAKSRPKIIAMSEINDLLTYEINPFFQQLWELQYRGETDERTEFNAEARRAIADTLGFDFVDVRVEFADPIIPFVKEFVDPLQAHRDHSGEPELILHMLCGLKDGVLNGEGCLAQVDPRT